MDAITLVTSLPRYLLSYTLIMVLLNCGAAATAETTHSIRGLVEFDGNPPKREALKIAGDRYCQDLYAKGGPLREEIIVNKNSTLKNVVVYLKKYPENLTTPAALADIFPLNLTRCMYDPHVLAVRAGQTIQIRNLDETVHNVNALPRLNPRFNKSLAGKGVEPLDIKFLKPELPIRLKCDVHPWMHAYIAVFDHPWFAVTGDDGSFEIPNLIPGEYVLEAWHEKFGTRSVEVLLKNDAPAEVKFQYLETNTRSFFGL